jgi:hypothetical protein
MDTAITKTGMVMPTPILAPVLSLSSGTEVWVFVGLEAIVEEVERDVDDEVELLLEEVGEVMLK